MTDVKDGLAGGPEKAYLHPGLPEEFSIARPVRLVYMTYYLPLTII
jgi:hypothetical protein